VIPSMKNKNKIQAFIYSSGMQDTKLKIVKFDFMIIDCLSKVKVFMTIHKPYLALPN